MIAALVVVLVALLALALFASLAVLGRVRELHHGYAGLLLLAVAPFLPTWLGAPVAALGLYLLVDDVRQHGVEALAKLRGQPVPTDYTRVHQVNVAHDGDTPPNVRRWVYTVAAAFVAWCAIGGVATSCGRPMPAPVVLSPAVVARLQLEATRDSERTVRDDERDAKHDQQKLALGHQRRAARAAHRADSLTASVDALAQATPAPDPADTIAVQWQRIADGYKAVVVVRTEQAAETDSAYAHAVHALSIGEVIEGQAEDRLNRVEANAGDLEATAIAQAETIAAADPPCYAVNRFHVRIRCPSRKAVAVAAATLSLGAVAAVKLGPPLVRLVARFLKP